MSDQRNPVPDEPGRDVPPQATLGGKPVSRRRALNVLFGGVALGTQAAAACSPLGAATPPDLRERAQLEWQEYIKKHYRYMTEEERAATIARLERLAKLRRGEDVMIQSTGAPFFLNISATWPRPM